MSRLDYFPAYKKPEFFVVVTDNCNCAICQDDGVCEHVPTRIVNAEQLKQLKENR